VIVVAVRWYLRFNLSYRDIQELLVERGVQVDHVTVYRWVQRFTPLFADAARFARHWPGDRWDPVVFTAYYQASALPTTWVVPCDGDGLIAFTPLPGSSTAHTDNVKVHYVNIAVNPAQ
jgi:hypothetical protein